MLPAMLTIAALQATTSGSLTPLDVVEEVIRRRDALADRAVFITKTSASLVRQATAGPYLTSFFSAKTLMAAESFLAA